MPLEWEERSLLECAIWYSGGTPSKSNADYWNGDIPWISAKSLTDFFIHDSEDRVTPAAIGNGTKLAPAHSILLLVRGMSLKKEFRMGLTMRPVAFNQDVKALIPKKGIEPTFLAYALKGKTGEILSLVEEAGHGTGVIPTSRIQSLCLSVPPITEQKKIGGFNKKVDDKIDLNRKMNETLESMARALYKSWFVDFDPVVARAAGKRPFGMDEATAALFPDRFVDSELGPIPEGWSISTVSTVCRTIRESVSPSKQPERIFAHYSIPAFDSGTGPNVEAGESIKSNKYRVTAHAVLLSKLNPETSRVWMPYEVSEGTPVCSTEFLVCEPKAPWTRSALYCLFTSSSFQVDFASLVGGTSKSHQRVKPGDFEAMKIPLPPGHILTEFDKQVGDLFELQASNQRESETLAQLRDLLLPKLLSGEIRIKDAEKAVQEAG